MNVKNPERGGIAISVQGRDKGCLYVICEVRGADVFVVDGVKRKLENPKKKNVKHLRLTAENVSGKGIAYPWDKAFDNRVAHLLKEMGRAEKS